MKLANKTRANAALLKTASARDEDRSLGCVITRPTYRVIKGELVETPDEPWPISMEPHDTPLGQSPGDKPFYMGGVDVLIGGLVRQLGGAPGRRLDVELEVGRMFRRRIAVFGDRKWTRAAEGRLVKTDPEPFVVQHLRYEDAFGGMAPMEHGRPMPCTTNPAGKGFYLNEASAEGRPLPNLEDPNHLIRSIDDFPDPVGLGYYPIDGSLRVSSAVDHPIAKVSVPKTRAPSSPMPDLTAATSGPIRPDQLLPTFFNMAHPAMILEAGKEPKPGDFIRLSHGARDGDLAFLMPDLSRHVYVQLEDRAYVFPMVIDQIGLVAGEGVVFFSLRCVFDYRLVRGERRHAALYAGPVPDPIPAPYRVTWPDEWDAAWWDRPDE